MLKASQWGWGQGKESHHPGWEEGRRGAEDDLVISCLVEWVDGDAARRKYLEKPWATAHTRGRARSLPSGQAESHKPTLPQTQVCDGCCLLGARGGGPWLDRALLTASRSSRGLSC